MRVLNAFVPVAHGNGGKAAEIKLLLPSTVVRVVAKGGGQFFFIVTDLPCFAGQKEYRLFANAAPGTDEMVRGGV